MDVVAWLKMPVKILADTQLASTPFLSRRRRPPLNTVINTPADTTDRQNSRPASLSLSLSATNVSLCLVRAHKVLGLTRVRTPPPLDASAHDFEAYVGTRFG